MAKEEQEPSIHDYREIFLRDAMIELEKCRERMQGFEIAILELKQAQHETREMVDKLMGSTHELLDILNACKGGLKVLGWLWIVVKWVGSLAATIAAIYTAAHYISTK